MKSILTFTMAAFLSCNLMAQSVTLKYNLETNKTYRAKVSSEQDISQTINGSQQSSDIKSTFVFSLKPTGSDANLISADVRFDTIVFITNMQGMSLNMNSANVGNLNSQNPSDIMSYLLNKLSHSVLHVKMTYTGNITEIMNAKPVCDSILAGVDTLKGQMMSMLKMQAKNTMNPASLKGMIESLTAQLPGKEVKAGDKWETRFVNAAGGFSVLVANTIKLKKVTGNTVELTGDGTMEPANQVPMEMNGMQITSDMRGQSKSNSTVDSKTGWIIKGSGKFNSLGNMMVKMGANDMQIPMELNGTTEIKALP